jgi:Cu/Ag efflux pump CusA
VGKRLQRVEGVARVEISGLTVREVRIDLDPQRLRAYGVTPAEIATALREANADQPVGLLTDPVRDALLRVEGRVRDPKQFEQLVVARRGGLALTLADLGTLVEREKEPDSLARVNGQRPSSSTSSSSRTPTSWPPATRQEGHGRGAQAAAARRGAAPHLRQQRLGQGLARRPEAARWSKARC